MKNRTDSEHPANETEYLLAGIRRHHDERIRRRFGYFYERLQALPRQTRRRLQRKLALSLAGAALMLALSGTPIAHAATITVDGTICTLANAITAANSDTATSGCIAGSGADVIDLQTNVTLSAALPQITSEITLEGNGHTIDGNNSVRVLDIVNPGNLTLNYATITGGSANDGGGINIYDGTVTLNNSTVSGNTASRDGGGIFNYDGTVTLNNSTVSGNTAGSDGGGDGGGIADRYGTMTLNNSTVSGNIADSNGGGIAEYDGTMTLNNSTVSGNTAGSDGGGISNVAAEGDAFLNLHRSLISGNTATSSAAEIFNDGTVNADDYNLFGDSSHTSAAAFVGFTPGASDITATSDGTTPTAIVSILETTLANNGVHPHTFTHALVTGSPAIDKAPNGASTGMIDQRGGTRDADGDGSGSTGAEGDIGAFEFGATQPNAVTLQSLSANAGATAGATGGMAAALGAVSLALAGLWQRHRRHRES